MPSQSRATAFDEPGRTISCRTDLRTVSEGSPLWAAVEEAGSGRRRSGGAPAPRGRRPVGRTEVWSPRSYQLPRASRYEVPHAPERGPSVRRCSVVRQAVADSSAAWDVLPHGPAWWAGHCQITSGLSRTKTRSRMSMRIRWRRCVGLTIATLRLGSDRAVTGVSSNTVTLRRHTQLSQGPPPCAATLRDHCTSWSRYAPTPTTSEAVATHRFSTRPGRRLG